MLEEAEELKLVQPFQLDQVDQVEEEQVLIIVL